MGKFLKLVGEIKTWGCLSFTGALCIYTLIDTFWGDGTIACATVYQLLALCGIITVLQYIFFSGQVLKKPSYYVRMALFCVPAFVVCGAFAWAFGWFPMENLGAWGLFVLIFFVIFAVFCLGFEIYFRILGKRYDAALGRIQQAGARMGSGKAD